MRRPHLAVVVAIAAGIPSFAGAQSLNQLGVARLNADAQVLWAQDGLPLAHEAARAEFEKLAGVPHLVLPGITSTIVNVGAIAIDVDRAPGFSSLRRKRLDARLPYQGSWRIDATVHVRVQGRLGRVAIDSTFPVGISLKNLSAAVSIDLDSSDPAAPRIERVNGPDPQFRMDLNGPPASALVLRWLDRGALDGVATAVVAAGARQLTESLDLRITGTPAALGAGAPTPKPLPALDLEAAALALEVQLAAVKMPFGTPLEIRSLVGYAGTWASSLVDPKFVLAVASYEPSPNSAEQTGYYLGALAHRYAATRSPEALDRINRVLSATRILMTMKGRPGDLNRVILPKAAMSSLPGKDDYFVEFEGETYLASDSTSRASYGGLLFGLAAVHELVPDLKIRGEAGQQIEMAVDYLLANTWTWRKRDGSFGERWQGALEHQYAWVLAAERANPAKYGAVREAYAGLADLLWVRAWTAVMDPHHGDEKLASMLLAFHVVLRLETDPVRWQRAYQGVAIMRKHIGHHQNAWFDAIYAAAVPEIGARLAAGNADELARWLLRPRRQVVTDVSGEPGIAHRAYAPVVDPALEFMAGPPPATVIIATYPIPVEKRPSDGFVWSASPFRLQVRDPSSNPDPYIEGESIDFLVAYWMSRYFGALPAPHSPFTLLARARPPSASR